MSEIKIPKELLNVIAEINFDEIQSQSYSPSHFRSWLCAWHEKIKTELYDFANNHELYQQGRADEQIQSIEDAKMQATEYLDALDKAKKETYQQGAREFANKLIDKCKENYENKDLALECKKCMIWRREEILEALTEIQKGEENEM